MTARKCPNCAASPVANHPENGCVLAALVQVVRERDTLTERQVRAIHANCDADALWNALGKIVDDLEEGFYNND